MNNPIKRPAARYRRGSRQQQRQTRHVLNVQWQPVHAAQTYYLEFIHNNNENRNFHIEDDVNHYTTVA